MLRFLSFFSVLIFFITSCDESPCENKNCNDTNNETGVCNEISGACICIDGWQTDAEGICTVQWTDKFVGTYLVSDTCYGNSTDTTINYPVTITASSTEALTFSNFGNKNQSVKAVHTSSTNLRINDTIPGGMIFTGTGKWLDSVLVVNYFLNDSINGNGMDTCIATFN